MIRRANLNRLIALLLLAAGLAAAVMVYGPNARSNAAPARGPLGLFTSLPIYRGEAAQLAALLDPDAKPHWAKLLIEHDRALQPLDVLTPAALAPLRDMLIAQPRALAPAENVALDDWVRAGGHVLLFADPLLTQNSQFALGDKRRPLDVALLSPILARWGLALQFDQAQEPGEHEIALLGAAVPVDLAGSFAPVPTAPDAPAHCQLLADGFAASCTIGRGRAVILADAELLDREGSDVAGRAEALSRLMAEAYATD